MRYIDLELMQVALEKEFIEGVTDSVSSLLDISTQLKICHKGIVEEFYDKNIKSPDDMIDFDSLCEYSDYMNNYRYRFIILHIKGDYVLFNLKLMDPIGAERYFYIREPKSLNGDIDSVKESLNIIKKFSCIKYVYHNDKDDRNYVLNNYYNTKDSCSFLFKSKWKSRRGINKLSKELSVETTNIFNELCIPEMEYITKAWVKNRKKSTNTKPFKNLRRIMSQNDKTYLTTVRYKDKLVAFDVSSIVCDRYAYSFSSKNISFDNKFIMDYCGCSEKVADLMRRYLVSFLIYSIHDFFINNMNLEGLFYSGDRKDNRLKEFKTAHFKEVVFYNRTELDEYIEGECYKNGFNRV